MCNLLPQEKCLAPPGLQRGQAPQGQELGRDAVRGSHTCSCLSRGAREALVDVQLRTQGLQEQALLLTLLLQERH